MGFLNLFDQEFMIAVGIGPALASVSDLVLSRSGLRVLRIKFFWLMLCET